MHTPAGAAVILGISKRSVWEKCRSNELAHLRYSKRCIRIRSSDIEGFLRKKNRG